MFLLLFLLAAFLPPLFPFPLCFMKLFTSELAMMALLGDEHGLDRAAVLFSASCGDDALVAFFDVPAVTTIFLSLPDAAAAGNVGDICLCLLLTLSRRRRRWLLIVVSLAANDVPTAFEDDGCTASWFCSASSCGQLLLLSLLFGATTGTLLSLPATAAVIISDSLVLSVRFECWASGNFDFGVVVAGCGRDCGNAIVLMGSDAASKDNCCCSVSALILGEGGGGKTLVASRNLLFFLLFVCDDAFALVDG
mmetsp:Transcript_18316/g.52291  ORF Transcript_18316/g.52291 Transcript_18316/m.52291 type:complete len:251 (-) Transcript_18316:76-828(-)